MKRTDIGGFPSREERRPFVHPSLIPSPLTQRITAERAELEKHRQFPAGAVFDTPETREIKRRYASDAGLSYAIKFCGCDECCNTRAAKHILKRGPDTFRFREGEGK